MTNDSPVIFTSDHADRNRPAADRLAAFLCIAGALGAASMAFLSNGFYQDDDIVHYKFASQAFSDPASALHLWGRPGYTLLAAPAAKLGGMSGCRALSVMLTALTAWMSYAIARRIYTPSGRRILLLAFAPLLVWLGPVNMTLAVTSLTETAAMFYMTAAVLLYLRGRPIAACAVMSLAIISRYELLVLGGLLLAGAVVRAYGQSGGLLGRTAVNWRLWSAGLALLWAPAAYVLAAWLMGLPDCCSPLGLFAKSFTEEYGRGSWHHFIDRWFVAAGAGTVALAIAGMIATGRRGWPVWSMAGGLVVLHTAIFMVGMFESGGYARFLVPAGGLTAALAACGMAAVADCGREGQCDQSACNPGTAGVPWPDGKLHALHTAVIFGVLIIAAALPLAEFNLPAWLSMTGGCLAGLMFAGLIASLRAGWKSGGWAVGNAAVAAAGLITIIQFACLVRPLRLDPIDSAVADVPIRNLPKGSIVPVNDVVLSAPLYVPERIMNAAISRADLEIQGRDIAGRPVMAMHPLVWFYHPKTEYCGSKEQAADIWRQAAQGTFFFWDSKYGGAADGRLYQALNQYGERLLRVQTGQAVCEVFVRKK
ncbi:MAG: hypothetical protein HZA50_04725 [Planctomycetes bacterium]|nr:hypothetical protein [Planctomycetota bacterium]